MTVATNIRLPEELLKELKHKAIEEKKSLNRLIVDVLESSLESPAVFVKKTDTDPFDIVIGSARSGCRDGSVNHDKYLYGKRR